MGTGVTLLVLDLSHKTFSLKMLPKPQICSLSGAPKNVFLRRGNLFPIRGCQQEVVGTVEVWRVSGVILGDSWNLTVC